MAFINDRYYINQVIEGNTNAFSVLVDQYKDLVFTLACKMLKNKEEAEEVAQDTFLKVFNSLPRYKEEAKFSTWIYKITYNTCLDRLKKNKKERVVIYTDDFNVHQANQIETVLENIDEKERNEKIQECMQLMPPEDAFLLTLYYFDDQSLEEIAKVIDCNSNNVKIKLYRSRKKMASILKAQLITEMQDYYES